MLDDASSLQVYSWAKLGEKSNWLGHLFDQHLNVKQVLITSWEEIIEILLKQYLYATIDV